MQVYGQCIANGLSADTWGSASCRLIFKLKAVKKELKVWYKLRSKDYIILKLQSNFDTLFHLDWDLENQTLYDNMYHTSQKLKDQLGKQNEFSHKVLWLHQGDNNTKYFYAKMSMRKHRNNIQALMDAQGQYIYDFKKIKTEAIHNNQTLFNGDSINFFPPISTIMHINNTGRECLSSPVTTTEIKQALFSIDDAKSPGPYGFSAKFYVHPLDAPWHSPDSGLYPCHALFAFAK